jgi:hypothetical protein
MIQKIQRSLQHSPCHWRVQEIEVSRLSRFLATGAIG